MNHRPFKLIPMVAFMATLVRQDAQAIDEWRTQAIPSTPRSALYGQSQADLTSASRFSREQWELDEAEWQRYLLLMKGIRGSISQANLSPLEVLGIHAGTEQERHEYAAKLAKMMLEDSERVLAFTRAYSEESAKLLKTKQLVDPSRLGLKSPQPAAALQEGDRVLFFTRIAPCPDCMAQLKKLESATSGSQAQFDIYFVDAKDDNGIRDWAKANALSFGRIKAGHTTLNYDNGTLSKLTGIAGTAPATFLVRGGQTSTLNPFAID